MVRAGRGAPHSRWRHGAACISPAQACLSVIHVSSAAGYSDPTAFSLASEE
jgi:hypothetical protein